MNYLFCVEWSMYPIQPEALGSLIPAQKEFLRKIVGAIKEAESPVEQYDIRKKVEACTSRKVTTQLI